MALLATFAMLAVAAPVAAAAEPSFGVTNFTTSVTGEDGADYTQAGGRPFAASTTIDLTLPGEHVNHIVTKLPAGFIGNPQAPDKCATAILVQFNDCPATSKVGFARPLVDGGVVGPFPLGPFPIFNVQPAPGQAALFAFSDGVIIPLVGKVRSDGDLGVTIDAQSTLQPQLYGIELTFCGYGAEGVFDGSHCIPPPTPAAVPFLTNPTECGTGAPPTSLEVDTFEHPGQFVGPYTAYAHTPPNEPSPVTGCDALQFQPTISMAPTTTEAATPTQYDVHIGVPQPESADSLATPPLRNAVVTLPQGVAVNPSLADGLQGCTDEQFAQHSEQPTQCPEASKIGSMEVTTPLLDHKLPGSIYVRQPDPGSTREGGPRGSGLYTIFLAIEDPISGIVVKLRGSVVPDAQTGRLTATFKDNPQLPFSALDLTFRGGPRGALINPPSCGKYTTEAQLTPWAGSNSAAATPSSTFEVSSGPHGGGCPSGAFAPKLSAGTTDPTAGRPSPFTLRLTREDGEQNLSALNVTLPKGLTAKLAGVPVCADAAAATGNCPAGSQIGTTMVGAGAGTNPLYIPQPGKAPTAVYLAGPFKGAPYSLVVKVPAQAGPFDLGTVAVRSGIYVDPETAQVSVKSDPLPQILEGVPIAYRDVRVDVNRPGFTLNPTSCGAMSVDSTITSAQGAKATPSTRFQVSRCSALGFEPGLSIDVQGGTKRGDFQKLKAVLTQPSGQANIGKVSVTLPHSEFLEQNHINTVCTRVQFGAGGGNGEQCPPGSIYGKAKAFTPLLSQPLEGPVFLRSSSHELPDLVAALHGQIEIALDGRIDSVNGGIRNSFEMVPDAPVSKFILEMKGGKKSLLVNSRNICKSSPRATVKMEGQNGRVNNFDPVLTNSCGKSKGKQSGRSKGQRRR
jgi:hypothetical protein